VLVLKVVLVYFSAS